MTMSFAFGNGGGSESGSSTPPEAQARNEDLPTVCRRINTKLSLFLEKPSAGNERLQSVQEQTRISLMVIAKAVEVYGLEHIALSFNGGKDCLVLLILLLAVLDEYYTAVDGNQQAKDTEKAASRFSADQVYPETDPSLVTFSTPPTPPSPKKSPNVSSRTTPFQIPTVYIHSSHPFAEVDSFVDRCVDEYHLNLLRFDEKSGMKNAFKVYLAGNPDVRLILVGTRRTDPHGGLLKHFDMTDGGWPEFMRCHGVIDWHYRDIWAVSNDPILKVSMAGGIGN